MKTALCTIAFRDRPFEVVLELAAEAGFDGVEPWGKPGHLPETYRPEVIQRASQAIRSRGLAVSQLGSYANPCSEGFTQEMEDALRTARDLGTDTIRVWAGKTGSGEADEAQWQTAISGLRGFADRASEVGMALVVEMHRGYLSDTAEGSLRLIDGVDRPNFGLNFQPMSAHTPEEVMETVRQVAPHVKTVHAQNYAVPGETTRALVSGGFVDYPTVVSELRKAGFDGFLEVEFVIDEDPEGALVADAAFLRSLCEG